jgi:cation transport regulator
MPYNTLSVLPDSVREHLPMQAREIYLTAFNSDWDEYHDAKDRRNTVSREQGAPRVAWGAVKMQREKQGVNGGV